MPRDAPAATRAARLMAIKFGKLASTQFTQVPNHWSRDRRLSLKALGALTYIVGHAADYPLTIKQMIAEFPDGKHAVTSALKELEALGYLKRVQVRRGGRYAEFDFVIDEFPAGPKDPSTGDRFSGTGKSGDGKTGDGKPATKKTIPKNTKVQEDQSSENATSLSADAPEDTPDAANRPPVPNQRRERVSVSKDQKFKSSKHRILAAYGWNEVNADKLIEWIEERYEPYSDGWWFTAHKNGSLLERIQEVLDDYNEVHDTKHTADMWMTSASS